MSSKRFRKIVKKWRQPILVWVRLKKMFYSPFVRVCLLLQARMWGGQIKIASSVSFKNKVYFQGEGQVEIGPNAWFGFALAGSRSQPILLQPREPEARLVIGKRTAIMNGCEFIARSSIVIGDDCLIGTNVKIMDSDFHGIAPSERRTGGKTLPVEIGNNVWIGDDVRILKGVIVGQDSVIGIGSIVTKNIPAGVVAAGIPAKVIADVEP